MLGFCFDHDWFGVAFLHFVGERHRDLDLREVDWSLCSV